MQTFPRRARYRGWPRSTAVTELAKSVPADLTGVIAQADQNQSAYEPLVAAFTTLSESEVAQLQRVRVQLRFRLRAV